MGYLDVLMQVALNNGSEDQLSKTLVKLSEYVDQLGILHPEIRGKCSEVEGEVLAGEDAVLVTDSTVDGLEDPADPVVVDPCRRGFQVKCFLFLEQILQEIVVVLDKCQVLQLQVSIPGHDQLDKVDDRLLPLELLVDNHQIWVFFILIQEGEHNCRITGVVFVKFIIFEIILQFGVTEHFSTQTQLLI